MSEWTPPPYEASKEYDFSTFDAVEMQNRAAAEQSGLPVEDEINPTIMEVLEMCGELHRQGMRQEAKELWVEYGGSIDE